MRKTGWQESATSPDWLDVETMQRAIGTLHSGRVECLVSPLGIGGTGGLQTCVRIVFDRLPGSSLPVEVKVERGWPCNEHAALSAHVYALLYDLDYQISKVYEQRELWK